MANKTEKMENIEFKRGQPLEEILRSLIESGMGWDDIAKDLEVSPLTLRDWRDRLGIRRAEKRYALLSDQDTGA